MPVDGPATQSTVSVRLFEIIDASNIIQRIIHSTCTIHYIPIDNVLYEFTASLEGALHSLGERAGIRVERGCVAQEVLARTYYGRSNRVHTSWGLPFLGKCVSSLTVRTNLHLRSISSHVCHHSTANTSWYACDENKIAFDRKINHCAMES